MMGPVARDVGVVAGSSQITDPGGAAEIIRLMSDTFAPDAAGSVYQEVVRLSEFQRAADTMVEYLVRFDVL